ncbi:acetyl xylan esterase [Actinoplanes sp. SE50]|uniref:acetylxylan esterase n=1 Tax=unclassified Actinoplanes TaxID=2626549 RepID=UPI00023EC319|nr:MULTISPECIES: acetylxylan esterase [unclassified Actinoplanes]AEV86371.1 cephalosporin-C deacetylase [Actinoplanes sp. SE50/110]ATO84768.1 acetyl xylan esterase [Actinoplanes sp. SE50]SLM02178.1 acetylxylan esterase [Actinoplanes sp. SE50/110]
MAHFDLPLAELRTYRSATPPPPGFDDFWARTLDEARSAARPAEITEVDTPLRAVTTYDVTFTGYAGQPIKAWLNVPAGAAEPLPIAVEFIGYGGGRGLPVDWLLWSAAGYAHLIMDTRGQGGNWRGGATPDVDGDGAGPAAPGYLTRGARSPETAYYRRLFTDAARAVETAAELPGVDASRLVTTGKSQGGALSIAAAGLVPDRVGAVVAGVPFLCDIRRAVTISDSFPFQEIVQFLRANPDRAEQTFATLDHFDVVNLARTVTAPALFSTALMDQVCPPSGVFAAYNELRGEKEIEVFEWDGHDGGRTYFDTQALTFAATHLT